MPVVTDVVESILQLSQHRSYGNPGEYFLSQFGLYICIVIIILLVLILFSHQTACSWRAAHSAESRLITSSKSIDWTSKPSARWSLSLPRDPTYNLGSLLQPRQGQGHFENQAKDARISIGKVVHRGSLSTKAPVGLGGAGEGSCRMMSGLPEGETTASSASATPSPSRGVSSKNTVSDTSFAPSSARGVLPLSFNGSSPLFPAADEQSRGHVSISRNPSPPSFILAWEHSGGEDAPSTIDRGRKMEAYTDTETHMSTTIYSPFGYHMTDDEHVSYTTAGGYYRSGSPVAAETATYRRTDPDFSRPPPPSPIKPPTLASQSLYSLYGTHQAEDQYGMYPQRYPYQDATESIYTSKASAKGSVDQDSARGQNRASTPSKTRPSGRGNKSSSTSKTTSKGNQKKKTSSKSIAIPSKSTTSSAHSRRRGYNDNTDFHTGAVQPSSSFPSTSPLLPPPPPNSDYPFDPAAVMFPGGMVADGGIKMIPTYDDSLDGQEHHHYEDDTGCSADGHGEIFGVEDNKSGDGWKRHTRVYGGGVCLACATAGEGGGGYYGARVRPEDMRR